MTAGAGRAIAVQAPQDLAQLPAPGLVEGPTRSSAEQTEQTARRLAAGLAASGAGPGDRVAFWAPTGMVGALLLLACWRLGAVAVPLHARASAAEVTALAARVRPHLLFTDPALEAVPGGLVLSPDRWAALLTAAPYDGPAPAPDADAVLLATSGSSGRSKLVRHSRRALAQKAMRMVQVHGLGGGDAVLVPIPLAHVSGLLNGVLLPSAAGMTSVLQPRWSADQALALIEDERVSFLAGPPTLAVQLMAEPRFSAARVGSLRLLSCGGAGVTEAFARAAAERLGCVVKRTYGSTEAPTVTTSWAGDPPELGWRTDGRAVQDVEVRVDPDSSEISVRGPEVFASYLDDPGTTAAVKDAAGWYRTGDRGRLDAGWLTVLGRLGDGIIRGGENIDPAEVEAVCAALAGVREAVVVGIPDDVMGERIGLAVVADPEPSLQSVREHCAARGLARFKTPERLLCLPVLPTLTVGKPDLAELRRLLS